jgi:hypothetical protein
MMKMRNYRRRYKFQGVKLSFKEGRESAMSMMVEVGRGRWRGRGGEVRGFFRRATSQRKMSRDFDTARATAHVQTWIDTGPWTSKGKSAKKAIGQAWSKWFHVSRIPSRNTDNPYFISAVKQTQQWGK